MSFYSGSRNNCTPGPINGNPNNGVCEKVCIHTDKVFDACLKHIQENNLKIEIRNFNPGDPQLPLTFISAKCIGNKTLINNLVIDRFEDKPCFARVTCDVEVPIEVTYSDAKGVIGTGVSKVILNQDVIMFVPQPSIFPFRVEAFASCVTPDGEFNGDNVFTINTCITIILKVLAEVDILVPSYGYCQIPECQEYTKDVCSGFFELPLYPQIQPNCNN